MSVLMYLGKLLCVRYFLVLLLDYNIIVFTLPYLRVIFFLFNIFFLEVHVSTNEFKTTTGLIMLIYVCTYIFFSVLNYNELISIQL